MSDWLFDHFGWILAGVIVAIAGVLVWAVASGGASCPKGQHAVLLYEQPIVITTNNVTSVSMVPIFGCQR